MNPNDLIALSNVRKDYGDMTELTHSVAMTGVQVPILYYVMDGLNVVKDGHRRLLAVRMVNLARSVGGDSPDLHQALAGAGYLDNAFIQMFNLKDISRGKQITDVPVIEVPAPIEGDDVALFQLIASRDGLRKPLNPMEEALAISVLLDYRSQQQVAEAIGKSVAYVSRRHRLINLHPDFQKAVADGDLDPRAAEQLLTLSPQAAEDEKFRRSIIAAKTVRRIKARVIAANSVQECSQGEGEEIEIDPLLIALREEAKIKAAAAASALNELRSIYEQVDQKPSLTKVIDAAAWMGDEWWEPACMYCFELLLSGDMCPAISPGGGHRCTRARGHGGKHVTCGEVHEIAVWEEGQDVHNGD